MTEDKDRVSFDIPDIEQASDLECRLKDAETHRELMDIRAEKAISEKVRERIRSLMADIASELKEYGMGIGLAVDRLDEVLFKRKVDDEYVNGRVREHAKKLIASKGFIRAQDIITWVDILGDSVYEYVIGELLGFQVDKEMLKWENRVIITAYAVNLAANFAGKGLSTHAKSASSAIDGISVFAGVANEFGESIGIVNMRILRLMRRMKGMKVLRTSKKIAAMMQMQKLAAKTNELEDEAVSGISDGFTWSMMAVLLLMSTRVNFDDLDYRNAEDFFEEMLFTFGMIAVAKGYNGAVRRKINSIYTQQLATGRDKLMDTCEEHPELKLVLDRILASNGNEVTSLIEAFVETLIELKDLINPVEETFETDSEGRIIAKEIDAVVMVTDLRNFTPLSEKVGGNLFAFLKMNYFPVLRGIIKKYSGKILNHTGDGLVIYFDDQKKHEESKELRATKCANELRKATNLLAEIYLTEGGLGTDGKHQTGIGLAKGTISVGDAFNMGERLSGTDVVSRIHNLVEKWMNSCDWYSGANTYDETSRTEIASIVGLGNPINMAARIEALDKHLPEHTCLIICDIWASLPAEERVKFEDLGEHALKGVEKPVRIYGIRRYAS